MQVRFPLPGEKFGAGQSILSLVAPFTFQSHHPEDMNSILQVASRSCRFVQRERKMENGHMGAPMAGDSAPVNDFPRKHT